MDGAGKGREARRGEERHDLHTLPQTLPALWAAWPQGLVVTTCRYVYRNGLGSRLISASEAQEPMGCMGCSASQCGVLVRYYAFGSARQGKLCTVGVGYSWAKWCERIERLRRNDVHMLDSLCIS